MLFRSLDDGRLTDGKGRTVDFKNTVVIMTSNLGSHILAERTASPSGTIDESTRRRVMDALREHFRPEFLNRIDEVVIFTPLDRAQLARIVDIQLGQLRRRLAERRIELEVTDAAKALLGREGYDPTFGARPLKRTIQRLLQDPLALRILEGEFKDGDIITVDAVNAAITFRRTAKAEIV